MPSLRNEAALRDSLPPALDLEGRLDELTKQLIAEFHGRVEAPVVAAVVRDSYDALAAHVRRTTWFYLMPWARSRLVARTTPHGREPSLSEILSVPVKHL